MFFLASFRAPRTVGQCMRIHAAVHERVCRAMAHIHKQPFAHYSMRHYMNIHPYHLLI